MASQNGHIGVVKVLVEHDAGMDVMNQLTNVGSTVLFKLLLCACTLSIIGWLVSCNGGYKEWTSRHSPIPYRQWFQ